MEAGAISMRYGKALFNYAIEHKCEDKVYENALVLADNLLNQPRFKQVLISPILARKEKKSLIIAASEGKDEICDEFERFVDLVLEQRREDYLQFMMMMYLDLYRKHKHISIATLITAIPVSKAIEDRVISSSSHLLRTKMELKTVVDPSIEGGFIFDINDYRLDASIATQLRRVKKQFVDKNRRIV
ncbi:F0F1 ATP synthase subunit delta [Bacteroides propionicifaciens]|uniref:F0F1 ATP synthase subunit delta n=1 Tax=Bacteroides propionicifaciens TaxID=392838 RepID=UPI00036EB56E|nr:F0F1 ATP synthase subunit delta [Bacteroides propionicifaciens]